MHLLPVQIDGRIRIFTKEILNRKKHKKTTMGGFNLYNLYIKKIKCTFLYAIISGGAMISIKGIQNLKKQIHELIEEGLTYAIYIIKFF